MGALRDSSDKMEKLLGEISGLNKQPSKIVTADGKTIYTINAVNRIPVKLSEVPVYVRNAVLAAEDKRFYSHQGVDLISMGRAIFLAAREGKASQGGSTLTMQLAKRMSDGSQRTLHRKIDDIALAYTMEREMTKDQILELYLNQVYFGEGAHGIAAAAKTYFNKDLSSLTIGEAAILARCVRKPSSENPIKNYDRSILNRDVVLDVMRTEGMITDAQYEAAKSEHPKINASPPSTTARRAPGFEYFVDHVIKTVERDIPGIDLKNGGYTIETTLDSRLQLAAVSAVHDVIAEEAAKKVNDGAIMVMDQAGQILVEVGGANYKRNNFNYITQGGLQPGSGFKPYVYAEAFKQGVLKSIYDQISNAPITKVDRFGHRWTPHNDSKRQSNPTFSAETALALSINLPAIHLIEEVTPEQVAQDAKDCFGIRSPLAPYEPLALGASDITPLEQAEGYSTFMLRGDRVRPYPVRRVVGPDGDVVKEYQPQIFKNVFDPQACENVDKLLLAVVQKGTGFQFGRDVPGARGKTGTTQLNRDAWFTGYTDGLLGVAWCGNERKKNGVFTRAPMSRDAFGGTVTVKIWSRVMKLAHELHSQVLVLPKKPLEENLATEPDNAAGAKFGPDESDNSAATTEPTAPTTPDQTGPEDLPLTDPAPADAKPLNPKPISNGGLPPDALPKPSAPIQDKLPSPSKRSETEEYVDVEVCADSGLRATMYCPETVTRRFKKGTEPKGTCNVHQSAGGDKG